MSTYKFIPTTNKPRKEKGEMLFYSIKFIENGKVSTYPTRVQRDARRAAMEKLGIRSIRCEDRKSYEKLAQALADAGHEVQLQESVGFYM